jgi:hypothetical protein
VSQPTPEALHVDHNLGEEPAPKRRRRKEKQVDADAVLKLEALVFKRDFSAEDRKSLAAQGKALPDGSYPMPDADAVRRAGILARSGHGDVAGASRLIAKRAKQLGIANPMAGSASKAEEEQGTLSINVELIKADGDFEGKVYGVVLEPNLEDSQGDIVTPEDIEKACHAHMSEAQPADVQHSGRDAGAVLIENYIAPADFTLHTASGERPVYKGSWMQAYQLQDPVVKEEVRTGKLTGFSLEGAGIRIPITS